MGLGSLVGCIPLSIGQMDALPLQIERSRRFCVWLPLAPRSESNRRWPDLLEGPNGWKYSRRVVDPKVFDQVKVGDKVDIIWSPTSRSRSRKLPAASAVGVGGQRLSLADCVAVTGTRGGAAAPRGLFMLLSLRPEVRSPTSEVVCRATTTCSFVEVGLGEVRQSGRKDAPCAGTPWNSSGRSFSC